MEQTARPLLCAGLVGLVLVAATTPAGAQNWSGSAAGRIEAILGEPNSLAAIIAAQSRGTSLTAALPLTRTDLRPAPLPAVATVLQPVDATTNTAAALERPDVFNSIAVPIARTPLDDRWDRVGSTRVGGRAGRFAAALRDRDERAKLDAINRYVNARIAFVDDSRQFGVADRWDAASDTLSRGRGDCEDYAIAKLAMLRRAGFADHNLYLVVVKDLARRSDHAVLVVRTGGRFLVLDNGTDTLVDSAAVRDYRPILTFTAGKRFAHGYRRSLTPQVILASSGVNYAPSGMTIAMAAGMPSSPFASR
ncbi:MAG: transglutaminase-like cysteine peptidase [Sphingomonas bacterium]|nr:transglutaminase-like cysteine peptidase [Sphingomonas bacterium]